MATESSILPRRNLDVVRAFAVCLVLAGHIANVAMDRVDDVGVWGPLSHAGVMFFFVHTSYVLMGSLARMTLTGLRGWVLTCSFYVRRAFRIYPLALVTMVAVVLLHVPWRPESFQLYRWPGWIPFAANLVLAQNVVGAQDVLVVLWSLPIELDMYLALPAIYWLVARHRGTHGARGRSIVLAAVVLLVAGIATAWGATTPVAILLRFTPCFAAGILAFTLSGPGTLRLAPVLGAGCIAIALSLYVVLAARAEWPVSPWDWGLCAVVGMVVAVTREVPASRFTRFAAVVAEYSYGIYLLHLIAFWLGLRVAHSAPWSVRVAITCISLIALPWLAYRLIERPGITLGQRLAPHRWKASLAASAAVS
jgi:peptidoglycan/LPS O-acetylase OafA/YrhL